MKMERMLHSPCSLGAKVVNNMNCISRIAKKHKVNVRFTDLKCKGAQSVKRTLAGFKKKEHP